MTATAERARKAVSVRAPAAEAMVVVLVLATLEALLFFAYFSGRVTAPWDFLGSYNSEAFAWWHDGSFFRPAQWMPYLWGGYPAGVSVQNSSWYLPVGLAASVLPFTIRVATMLQALHVALGALGMYVLVRQWRHGRAAATFAMVAYFFAVGFFSNAQHVDIVRAYAWLPWLFLIASPYWPWRRWWAVPAGAVIVWQAAISSYPGILLQLGYALIAWVIVCQMVTRARVRTFLLPLAITGLSAVLLSVVKYLPVVLVRGAVGSPKAAGTVFDAGIAGTLFFPFDLSWLPNDPTMRSLFVVAPVLPLALLARRRDRLTVPAVAVLAMAGALGLPLRPWARLVDELPGMSLSRFQTADSRALLVFALIALAAVGFSQIAAREPSTVSEPVEDADQHHGGSPGAHFAAHDALRWQRGVLVLVVPLAALLLARLGSFPVRTWLVPFVLIVVSCVLVMAAIQPSGSAVPQRGNRAVAAGLIVVAAASGAQWAYADARTWRAPRILAEVGQWGATSGTLVLHRQDAVGALQRPARAPLPADVTIPLAVAQSWDSAYYSGSLAVGGYINLSGMQSYDSMVLAVTTPSPDLAGWQSFWSAPGIVLGLSESTAPATDAVAACVEDGHCGDGLTVRPAGYANGSWQYDVQASRMTPVVFNEAFYRGLTLRACSLEGPAEQCRELSLAPGAGGSTLTTMPTGHYMLRMAYSTPGQSAGWIAFWLGVAVALLAVLVRLVPNRARRRSLHAEAVAADRLAPDQVDPAATV